MGCPSPGGKSEKPYLADLVDPPLPRDLLDAPGLVTYLSTLSCFTWQRTPGSGPSPGGKSEKTYVASLVQPAAPRILTLKVCSFSHLVLDAALVTILKFRWRGGKPVVHFFFRGMVAAIAANSS